MKFEKNKIYEGIFLSDVHYLLNKKIKSHKHKELFQFLDYLKKKNVRFKNIYLVGDIIENWFFSAARKLKKSKKKFNKLFDRLDSLSALNGNKIYIVGNHDSTSYLMNLPPKIERYLREKNWKICKKIENETLIVVHGHQGQYNRFTWIGSIFILRFLHAIALFLPNLFRFSEAFYQKHLNRQDPTTTEEILKYYERLSRITHQSDRVLISGHTHDFLCIPHLKIINTGDWVKSNSFVLQDDFRFIGAKMNKRGEFSKEFIYKHQ
ncbi:UDP-2,3-diacylglucosamine diphosphatase [Leptospira mayottensis]|uniref:UDP-2,3-diacylglucosamine diphosphatase n=1 Tax=Leptospira mayottensis TaxID=1137606 RepID=A0ABM6YE25_9LEPT|nr:UDP-2,3-diacylglucosamine diphosphatase [Leptospira mayottensis]AXR62721.1 UDP-2,3-diacylglucosamine diphosphatase [Leptospira mayottensis]AXR66384.1 UDP-2,3-diacylglucosamine diphosphatase [Leptospira mayottensis]AZQ04106.1 UDP-2,3-diacylglucosamine diphosphatase [Leptospira mayottensis 200901116]TGN14206.1 UDP-2,3-diacylglucosamine diphosphatase [Leptospira mayottensis]